VTVAAYPLADLMVMALLVRLLLEGDLRNPTVAPLLASLCFFLGADVGWSVFIGAREITGTAHRLLTMMSLSALALMGAATLHPGIRDMVPGEAGSRRAPSRPMAWAALAVATLIAPTVLLVRIVLDLLLARG